jgi:cell division septation protein DedD
MSAKPRPTTPVPPTLILDEEKTKRPWSLELTLSQMIIGWSAIGAMMILVFLFGLYAGRNHGMELALEEQATPRLRLPVTDTKVKEVAPEVAVKEDRFDFGSASPIVAGETRASFTANTTETLAAAENRATETLSERVASIELSPELTGSLKPEAVKLPEKPVENVAPPPVGEKKVEPVEKKLEKKNVVETAKPAAKGGYFVQVAAPDSMAKAQSLVSRLRSKGITAVIRDAQVNGKLHFRVLVGPYTTSEGANTARQEVVRSGVISGQPFVKKY